MSKLIGWVAAATLLASALMLTGCGSGQASQSEIDATTQKMQKDTAGQTPVPMPDVSTAPPGGGGGQKTYGKQPK